MQERTPLSVFRLVAAEFKDVEDVTVLDWISLTEPLVSKRRFGRLWSQALALLTAHRMKMNSIGEPEAEDPLADINAIDVAGLMRVTNYSEGETSIGFNTNIAQYTEDDAELAMTVYGIQYLSLRRKYVVPIISAGER